MRLTKKYCDAVVATAREKLNSILKQSCYQQLAAAVGINGSSTALHTVFPCIWIMMMKSETRQNVCIVSERCDSFLSPYLPTVNEKYMDVRGMPYRMPCRADQLLGTKREANI